MTGQYTDIVYVGGPDSALADAVVVIPVEIVNKWTQSLRIYCTGDLSTGERFIDRNEVVSPGQTWYLSGIFYMPNQSVTITIKSWYESGGEFYVDDTKTKNVSLAELKSEISQFSIVDYIKV